MFLIKSLLQSSEPSIRWKVRVNVLGEDENSPDLLALRQEIRQSARVKTLLANCLGYTADPPVAGVYAKWQGIHWVLATLADIGYPPGDEALMPLKDRLLNAWLAEKYYQEFEVDSKAKVYTKPGVPVMLGRYRRCASQQANALYALLKLGLPDARIENLVERLLHWQWPDGGWNCDKNPGAHHSSFMETLLPLKALALYAKQTGSAKAKQAADRAAEIFLKRHLYKAQSTGQIINPEFVLLHYPLYWHYDILGGLKVMAEAGYIANSRCADAIQLLQYKQLPGGGWSAEKSYYKVAETETLAADYVNWGGTAKYKMNEWITADALYVLKAAGL